MNKDIKIGTICAICSALVFGLTPVLASITFEMGGNPLTLTFYRNNMAIPVLFVILLVRKVDLRVTWKEFLELALVSVLFSVTTTYILYDAYHYIGVGLSTTLHFLYPMFTVLFSWLIFKKKPDKIQCIALIMATVGVAMATGESDSFAVKGIVIAIISAVTYAGYLLGMENTSIKKMDSMKGMFYMCIVNSAAVFLFDLPTGGVVYALEPKVMLYTFIVGIANSAVAYVMVIVGIKKIGASNVAIFSMLEPVSGVVGGFLLLGEKAPLMKVLSCIIILTAVAVPIGRDWLAGRQKGNL